MLLPGMHGIDVCRRLRAVSRVPILMVSAVDSELDVVLGLELGASGYVTKPFRLRELVARMHAILRRVAPRGLGPLPLNQPAVTDGPAEWHDGSAIDPTRHRRAGGSPGSARCTSTTCGAR